MFVAFGDAPVFKEPTYYGCDGEALAFSFKFFSFVVSFTKFSEECSYVFNSIFVFFMVGEDVGVFVDMAVAEGDGYKLCTDFVEFFAYRELRVLDAAAFFVVDDASDLDDMGFNCIKGLVGGVEEEVEGVAVEAGAGVGEFVGGGAGVVGAVAFVVGELCEELSELLGVDVEVALGGGDEVFFDFGFEVEEFVFVGVEPVVGVCGFAPNVEDVVVNSEAELLLRFSEVEVLVEEVGNLGLVFGDGVGDGAEGLGSGFVVGFEFDDGESGGVAVVVEGFDGGGEGLGGLVVGVVEEGFEGGVDEAGVEDVVFGFVLKFVLPLLACIFVDAEGAFEVGFFFAKMPVADASGRDAGDGFEFFVGFVCEVSVVAGGGEGAVPEGVDVGVVEGGAGLEVGVSVEVVFEGLPGGVTVVIEKVFGFRRGGEIVAEAGPFFNGFACLQEKLGR